MLIFVVDSNDRERMEECKDELWRFLGEDELKESILLVLANKQDLPNAMSTQELTEKLELDSIHDRDWCKLQSVSTTYIVGAMNSQGTLLKNLMQLKTTVYLAFLIYKTSSLTTKIFSYHALVRQH